MCWGHVSGVTESNVRTLADHWTGTGTITGTGDSEKISLDAGQYMVSEVMYIVGGKIIISQNKYVSGDTVTLKYRHGTTEANCLAASWNLYTTSFTCLGFLQVRIESTQ